MDKQLSETETEIALMVFDELDSWTKCRTGTNQTANSWVSIENRIGFQALRLASIPLGHWVKKVYDECKKVRPDMFQGEDYHREIVGIIMLELPISEPDFDVRNPDKYPDIRESLYGVFDNLSIDLPPSKGAKQ